MSTRNIVAAAVAAASWALLPAAQAASTASASATLTGLGILLIDLDPGDGISPYITFLGNGYGDNMGSATGSHYDGTYSETHSRSFSGSSGPWAPAAVAAGTAYAGATAGLTGNGTPEAVGMFTTAWATSPSGLTGPCSWYSCSVPNAQSDGYVHVPGNYGSQAFLLSANTVAVFGAQASVSASAVGGGSVYYDSDWWQHSGNGAGAAVQLVVSGPSASGGDGTQYSSANHSVNAYSQWDWYYGSGWIDMSVASAGSVAASFLNMTNFDMQGNLSIRVSSHAYAHGDVLPVPEPGSWALMLGGTVMLGAWVRRRRGG